MKRALLALVLFAPPAASACECPSGVLEPLRADPGTAKTALLGKAEPSGRGWIFRVEASWTKYTGSLLLPGETKCDLRPASGKRRILLSARSLAWFEENKASPSICDSILLEPAKAEKAVARLAAGTGYGNHFGYNPSWGWCRKDTECVLADGVCAGQDAIHSRFKSAHDEWRDRLAPTVDCEAPRQPPGRKARCVENFCAAYSSAP